MIAGLVRELRGLAEAAREEHAACEHRFEDGVLAAIQEVESYEWQPEIVYHFKGDAAALERISPSVRTEN